MPFSRSGVSPLFGAVMLVAFVMVVAGIMTGWLTNFTEDQARTVENDAESRIQCRYAGIFIEEVLFDDDNDEVDVSVSNSGTVDLSNISIILFTGSGVTNSTVITSVEAGGTPRTGTVIYKKAEQPDKARAQSQQCPGVVDEETTIKTR